MEELQSRTGRRVDAVVGVLLAVGLNAAAVLLATRMLGAEGRGRMVALSLVPTVIHVLFGLGAPAANVFFAAKKPSDSGRLSGNTLLLSLVTPGVALLVAWLLPTSILEFARVGLRHEDVLIAIALAPPLLAFQQLVGVVQGLAWYPALRLGRAVQGGVLVIGVLLFPLLGTPTPRGLFFVWVFSYLAGAAYLTVLVGRRYPVRMCFGQLRTSLSFGMRAMWTQVWEFVNMRGDQVLVATLADARVLGLYSLAVSLSEVLLHVPNAVSGVVFSDTAAGRERSRHTVAQDAGKAFALTLLGAMLLVVATWLVIAPLIRLADTNLALVLTIMAVPVASLATSRMLGAFLMGCGRPATPGAAAAVSFFVTVGADILLIPRFEEVGAAVGVSLGYISAALVMIIAFARIPRGAELSVSPEAEEYMVAPGNEVL